MEYYFVCGAIAPRHCISSPVRTNAAVSPRSATAHFNAPIARVI